MARQHHKGKKRPRSWHRGRSSEKRDARALRMVEDAERRADKHAVGLELVAVAGREVTALWGELERAAPFVPVLWPNLDVLLPDARRRKAPAR